MARSGAAFAPFLAVILFTTAACTEVRAAEPFPDVPIGTPAHPSHRWAYASMLAGAGLVGGSFVVSHRADDTYRDYLAATDPHEIERLYDRAVLQDRIASTTLLAGEGLIALGIYLRFIRHAAPGPNGLEIAPRTGLILSPRTCALSYRF